MWIGNHTFYERYLDHIKTHTANNGYYGLLADEGGKWFDSHQVGIDGPMFHFSNPDRTILHIWLLSFKRHAFDEHNVLQMD